MGKDSRRPFLTSIGDYRDELCEDVGMIGLYEKLRPVSNGPAMISKVVCERTRWVQ